MIVLLGSLILIALIVLGLPIGFALGIAGLISLFMVANANTVAGLMANVVHHTVSNYVILTIPAFVMMSEFLSAGGIADDMMIACNRALRRLRGGLVMACVLAGAILAASSGSSTASVATIARAAYPTMRKLGYNPGLSIGTIAISGTLAIMIPPSIALVVYGIITEDRLASSSSPVLVPASSRHWAMWRRSRSCCGATRITLHPLKLRS